MTAVKLKLGILAALGIGALASAAHAQWTVTNLNPAGSTGSQAYAASGGQQAGNARVGGVYRASLWSGTAASWADLNPAGATGSVAYAASGGQQAGYADVGGVGRASLWSGTAASWVDLTPAGSTSSVASAISGGQQAGYADVGGVRRASLWSGTAASWVDLHPAGSTESVAYAASGGQQAGFAQVGGEQHASLWSGTAASWIDLNPAGSDYSHANVISGGQQGGFAYVGGVYHACLWSGTAASWVDLNPAGSVESYVYAMSGGQQVGVTMVNGAYHASLWSGTPGSWVDLHAFLPDGFTTSYAHGISSDATHQYVAGYGFNSLTNRNEALLWTQTLCSAANIVSQPQASATCPSGPAGFAITAAGSGTLTYQWQYQSGPDNPDSFTWTNLVNGRNPDVGPFRLNAFTTRTRLLVVDHDPTQWPDPADHIPYIFRCIVTNGCGSVTSNPTKLVVDPSDMGQQGGLPGRDGLHDNNDFIVFINYFFETDPIADLGSQGGFFGSDGLFDNNDFIVFIDQFFAEC